VKLHAAINRLVCHLLSAHSFTPLTWTANPTEEELRTDNPANGLFFWPDMPPARSLTPQSAPYVANMLTTQLGLRTAVSLTPQDKRSCWVEALDTIADYAARTNVPTDSELWTFINCAHNTRVSDMAGTMQRFAA